MLQILFGVSVSSRKPSARRNSARSTLLVTSIVRMNEALEVNTVCSAGERRDQNPDKSARVKQMGGGPRREISLLDPLTTSLLLLDRLLLPYQQ